MKDKSKDTTIQAKGYVNADFKVSSQYTITLYHWQMLVKSGAQNISWKLILLPNAVGEEKDDESGYYEYYVVFQATRGTPVHIESMDVAAMFRNKLPLWVDDLQGLSASTPDIWITPPRGVCLPGDFPPAGTCKTEGVCGIAPPKCIENQWACPQIDLHEPIEVSCDGLDNDCDGQVDEDLVRECESACGAGIETCSGGAYQGCTAPTPTEEICDDGVDNDCDGVLDNGCEEPETDPPAELASDSTEWDLGKFGADDAARSPDPTDDTPIQTASTTTPNGRRPATPTPATAEAGCTTTPAGRAPNPVPFLLLLLVPKVALCHAPRTRPRHRAAASPLAPATSRGRRG